MIKYINESNEKEKIIVAHPLQQHSFNTAVGLKKANILGAYITSFYYNEKLLFNKLLITLLPKYAKRISNRRNEELDDNVIIFNSIWYLFLNLIYKIDKHNYIYPFMYNLFCDAFGKKVAKYCLKKQPKAVYMFDTTAKKCFEILKKKNTEIIKILDMSSPNTEYIRNVINDDILKMAKNVYKDKLKWYNTKLEKKSNIEIELADIIFFGSEFCKTSIKNKKYTNKNFVIPYGSNIKKCDYINRNYDGKLIFLFAGRVEYAKGIYYLLEAFYRCQDIDVELKIVGQNLVTEEMLLKYENVNYIGLVRPDEMNEIYKSSHIYIMPSLFEGLSLTLLEALSSSMPIIATYNSGAQTIIENGKEGFLIKAQSVDEIEKCVRWFYNNRKSIEIMAKQSYKKSCLYSWERYHKELAERLKNSLHGEELL